MPLALQVLILHALGYEFSLKLFKHAFYVWYEATRVHAAIVVVAAVVVCLRRSEREVLAVVLSILAGISGFDGAVV